MEENDTEEKKKTLEEKEKNLEEKKKNLEEKKKSIEEKLKDLESLLVDGPDLFAELRRLAALEKKISEKKVLIFGDEDFQKYNNLVRPMQLLSYDDVRELGGYFINFYESLNSAFGMLKEKSAKYDNYPKLANELLAQLRQVCTGSAFTTIAPIIENYFLQKQRQLKMLAEPKPGNQNPNENKEAVPAEQPEYRRKCIGNIEDLKIPDAQLDESTEAEKPSK